MDHATALAELDAGNQRYAQDAGQRAADIDAAARQRVVAGQAPFAAVLACADSRVVPEYLFDQGLGDLFVVRVAGNVATAATIGSLEFAVEALNVPLIVVLGHQDCGAVTAALEVGRPSGDLGRLVAEVDVGNTWPMSGGEKLAAAVEHNAQVQADRLVDRSFVIRDRCHTDELRVAAGVYQLDSGRVEWLMDEG